MKSLGLFYNPMIWYRLVHFQFGSFLNLYIHFTYVSFFFSRVGCGQSHAASLYWRCLRGKHQARPIFMPGPKNAPDPAREGHRHWIYQERGLQICEGLRCLLPQAYWDINGLLQVLGALTQWLQVINVNFFSYLLPKIHWWDVWWRIPIFNLSFRKVRVQGRDGKFALSHMDEFIDELLTQDRYGQLGKFVSMRW